MIKICNISSMEQNENWENWMIVRAPDTIPLYAKHVPELSPSPELFAKYMKVYEADTFDEKFFREVYVPQFIEEFIENKEANELLNYLCRESETKNFYLGCYCTDEKLCHRSIVAGLLLGAGAKIETNPEYIKYYNMSKSKLL